MKALVVEDDLKSQCMLANVLAECGHDVTTFENAEQAIMAYQKEFYPLLFVDVGLPGMDGLQFCRWVRDQPQGQQTFVIVATEPNRPSDLSLVLTAGANDFIPKPYDLNGLRVRLTIGERQMASFFEQQQLEEALQSETQRWTQAEVNHAETCRELEAAVHQRENEIARLREQLDQNAPNAEADKAALQSELASRTKDVEQFKEELRTLREECDQLRLSLATANRGREVTETRLQEAEAALENAAKNSENSETLDPGAREALEETVRSRDAEIERLAATAKTLREEQAQLLKEHTDELLHLSRQMRENLEERQRVESELSVAHDEMARRARQQIEDLLHLSDECKAMVAERRRLETELERMDRQRNEFDLQLNRTRQELDEVRAACRERDDTLDRCRKEAQDRTHLIGRIEEDLKTHREARKRVEARWRAFARLGSELNEASTAEQIARVAARSTQELVGWDLFSLDAYEAAGDWIHPILSVETMEGQSRETGPLHPGPQPSSLMRRVLEDGPQLILRPSPSCSQTDLLVLGDRARRSASLLYVPLALGERVVGFLSVRSGIMKAYDSEDVETLQMVGTQCAGALERIERAAAADSPTAPPSSATTPSAALEAQR